MFLKEHVFRVLGVYFLFCEDSRYQPKGWKSAGTTTGGKKSYLSYQLWGKTYEIKGKKKKPKNNVSTKLTSCATDTLWCFNQIDGYPRMVICLVSVYAFHHFFPPHFRCCIITPLWTVFKHFYYISAIFFLLLFRDDFFLLLETDFIHAQVCCLSFS